MPNTFLPSSIQAGRSEKEGCVLIGDAWNMRHPLTGGELLFINWKALLNQNLGGMTVALTDVVRLTNMLSERLSSMPEPPESDEDGPLSDWKMVSSLVRKWHWSRKPLSSTVNILSVALYDLFGADGELLSFILRYLLR